MKSLDVDNVILSVAGNHFALPAGLMASHNLNLVVLANGNGPAL